LSFPDGYDVEAFTSEALSAAAEGARENYDREHVTPWIQREFRHSSAQIEFREDLSRLRLTIDEPEDLTVISGIFRNFGDNLFGVEDVAVLAAKKPELFVANQHLDRNQGATMGTGEKLWSRAKRVIPGGTMLLSKKPDRFLPEGWPSYFSRTAGCQVWDLDDQPFWDVGLMGVGTNILGYSHPAVDEAVKSVVERGNLSSLNAPEEVLLAEKLCEMHPWASMARFTRSGGEAMAVAVRIARAASGKDVVAFCGYHGWHDWYLSANISSDDALSTHLLPGLETEGVPDSLRG
jgi:glutamate-1-semialdehyde 2,1-aminomutase